MAFCQSHLQSMGISVGHARLFGYLPVHFVFATSGVSENNVDKTSKNASIHAWSAGCVLACGVTARSPRSFPRARLKTQTCVPCQHLATQAITGDAAHRCWERVHI